MPGGHLAPVPSDDVNAVDADRTISFERVFNFRDLGGYPTSDGRVTRWRALYRADSINRLSDADMRSIRALGLRTVIDLRTPGELEARGRFPLHAHPVDYHHLSLMDVMWEKDDRAAVELPPAEFLLHKYLEMMATAEDRIAAAFRILASTSALPAVFHCAAGKDRTGILAGLLLSSLGVDDEHVVADYALTGPNVARMMAWAREADPKALAAIEAQPAVFLVADPAAMEGLLGTLRDGYGSTRQYVLSLGVTEVEFDRLESAVLERR
jgi:protein-tyrosine phosphatase